MDLLVLLQPMHLSSESRHLVIMKGSRHSPNPKGDSVMHQVKAVQPGTVV